MILMLCCVELQHYLLRSNTSLICFETKINSTSSIQIEDYRNQELNLAYPVPLLEWIFFFAIENAQETRFLVERLKLSLVVQIPKVT